MHQHEDGSGDTQHKLHHDPVVTEQAPFGSKRRHETCRQRGEPQGDDHDTVGQVHREIAGTHKLNVRADEAGDRQSKEGGDRAGPAHRNHDVDRKCEFAQVERHGHGRC